MVLVEGSKGARRGALWLGFGLVGGLCVAVFLGGIGSSSSGVTAAPAQVDDGGPADHDHADHDHASTLGSDGRFTGPGEVWPPQIRGATDIVALDFAEVEAQTSERAVQAVEVAPMLAAAGGGDLEAVLAEPAVAEALGERHVLTSVTDREVVPGSSKGDPEASLALLYSHDRAATVEVYFEGSRVVEVISRPGSEDQPPLGVDEKHRAGELARGYWDREGDDRVGELEAFVILAVLPGGVYYDSRVAYVSFHADNEARPELLTWIDLTTGSVVDAEVDR